MPGIFLESLTILTKKKKKSNSAIFPKILTSNYILNQIKLFDNQTI